MKQVKLSIQAGAKYLYTRLGEVVTAIQQVATVKGLPMWEVECAIGSGTRRRKIVSARSLRPLPVPAGAA